MNWLSGLIQQDDTVEKLHAELSKALAEQKKRFLIVIDDIDRLVPDEALLIFRLVKSVGRLSNVVYLLVFDRRLAEAIVTDKYPTEGPHYLGKIIQAGFDIPQPREEDLRQELLEQLGEICGTPPPGEIVRFMNVFYDVIAPEIRTPRDLVRLTNSLAVTWPAVAEDVDRADFIGLEVLRLLRPAVYQGVRSNKERLTTTVESSSRWTGEQRSQFDKALLSTTAEADRPRLRQAVMRLFPPLASVWGNTIYGEHSRQEWSRERRACAPDHFDSYFRFAISEDVLPKRQIDELLAHSAEEGFVAQALREGLAAKRSNGGTKAALILEELNLHANSVADEHVQPLLTAMFKLGDEVDVSADEAKAFSIGDNPLRIHWLLRRLTLERFDLARRSAIFMAAVETAALGWLVQFASSAYNDYHPRPGKSPAAEDQCLTTAADAEAVRSQALARMRKAAASGELAQHKQLAYLLYRWRDFAEDDGAEVKRWTDEQLARDDLIVEFARAFTSHGWSQSASDSVVQRTTLANVGHLEKIMDKARFRARVEDLAARGQLQTEAAAIITEFLNAWRRHDTDPHD
jgi:predicted KAP-like P-loop ATPase